jgi:hypothetical protein
VCFDKHTVNEIHDFKMITKFTRKENITCVKPHQWMIVRLTGFGFGRDYIRLGKQEMYYKLFLKWKHI